MVANESLQQRKSPVGSFQSGRGRLRELFITKFKSQFKRGFTKVVLTRAGRLRQWSQGELRLSQFVIKFRDLCIGGTNMATGT